MFRSTLLRFVIATCMSLAISVIASAAHAATFTVTNTNDSGAGSLRQAIISSNATTLINDTIAFNVPGPGVKVISPLSALPTVTDTVTIDGYTQPGAALNTLAVGDNAVILIQLDGIGAGATSSGLSVCASNVIIRGLSITRFQQNGIALGIDAAGTACASPPTDASITGNFIGLAPDGITAAGQRFAGILIRGASGPANHAIGGAAPALRDIISANGTFGTGSALQGIVLVNSGVSGTAIDGNYIGTDASGTLDRGNPGEGIRLGANATGATVGGIAPNRIAYNDNGIVVETSATGNDVTGNDFFANDNLGIDLSATNNPDGVTPNDAGDVDTGGNDLQNFPSNATATRVSGGIHLTGTLLRNPTVAATFTFGVYASSVCDASNGEGERFLGTQSVSFGIGSQSYSFDFASVAPLPVGTKITLTATNSGGSTSEFSPCRALDNTTPLVVTNTNDSGAGSLRQAMLDANAQAGGDTITFNIPGTGVQVITPLSALPSITETATIDGYTQPLATPNTSTVADNAVILIQLDGVSAGAFAGLSICTHNVTVRGLSITRFAKHGIAVGEQPNLVTCTQNPLSNVALAGNFLGLSPSGAAAGNSLSGVVLEDTSGRVGGLPNADRNVISSNTANGVVIGANAASINVDGNFIGTGLTTTTDRGNGFSGVSVGTLGANAISVGSNAPNTIRNNREGVRVGSSMSANTTKAEFFANDISANDNLGIDLAAAASSNPDGVTPNDADDADAGPNNLQNFPVLSAALQLGGTMRFVGALDVPAGIPTQPHVLAFYANTACDASGFGEGELYLGTVSLVIPNASESFTVELANAAPIGSRVTATATLGGSTSEFSNCVTLVDGDPVFSNSFE